MLIEAQGSMRPDILAYVRSFDLVGLHLAKPRIGYGLERAPYALNPALPCQHPLLAAAYVADHHEQTGRASWRERGCPYVALWVGAGTLQKKTKYKPHRK